MKKFIALFYSVVIAAHSFASDPGEIDKRLVQSFDSAFPYATEVNWFELATAYQVSFKEKDIRFRIEYAKDGSYVNITRYYLEKDLPYHLRYTLRQQYPGKTVYGITEVSTVAGSLTHVEYFIILEDAHKWTTVKMDNDGTMVIVQRARKSK